MGIGDIVTRHIVLIVNMIVMSLNFVCQQELTIDARKRSKKEQKG
jgi:hypothetical protein